MKFSDSLHTEIRLSHLDALAFCEDLSSGHQTRPSCYRDNDLKEAADQHLHELMNYRSEHADPLQF